MKNIKPEIWGPHGWKFMHYVSLGYPEYPTDQDKIEYKSFYLSLGDILPCKKCGEGYKRNIIEFPIDSALESKDLLIHWVIDIHNKVNKELNKPVLSYEEAIGLYLYQDNSYQVCFKILVILVIILCLIYYLYIKK